MSKELQSLRPLFASSTNSLTAGLRSVVVYGENDAIDVGTVPETLWIPGGVYEFPDQPTTATIVSTNNNDTLSGTGASRVIIIGLDFQYRQVIEIVSMTGTAPIETQNEFLRINQAFVGEAGSSKHNEGNISVTVDNKLVRYIGATHSLDRSMVYTVPKDHTLFLVSRNFSIIRAASSRTATIYKELTNPSLNVTAKGLEFHVDSDNVPFEFTSGSISLPNIGETVDIVYNCSFVSGNETMVTGKIRGLLAYKSLIPKYDR